MVISQRGLHWWLLAREDSIGGYCPDSGGYCPDSGVPFLGFVISVNLVGRGGHFVHFVSFLTF